VRVVLAEDLVLLRDGLIRLLEAHDFGSWTRWTTVRRWCGP
jgi:hypothetical protein